MKLLTYLDKFGLLDRVKEAAGDEYTALESWSFKINFRAKSRFGCCKLNDKIVEVTNEYYIHGGIKDGQYDDFINTLLHETAHAIVFERYGRYHNNKKVQSHGREWRMVMYALGITNPTRCGESDVLKEKRKKSAKHRYYCKDCDYVYESQRALKNIKNRTHKGCDHKPNGGHFHHEVLR